MEKVKISRAQADAINWVTDRQGRDLSHTELITEHSKDSMAWGGKAKGLKRMPLLTLVDALRIGYEVEEEKYEVGDWVITKESGRIAKITRVAWDMAYGYWNNGPEETWNRLDHIRHATPEEIKAEQERIPWKSIGRKVGTFHLDDIYVDQKGMPFLITDTTHLASGIISSETAIEWHRIGNFKGLYPAESFVELSGESHDN